MYGKHFESLYEGSMIGSGPAVFAVWGYVIAKQKPDRKYGSTVELNPKLLAMILGGEEKEMETALEFLRSPDPNSRCRDQEGRRLVRIGQFEYWVVTGAKYRAVRDTEMRKEQNRVAQRAYQDKKKEKARRKALVGAKKPVGKTLVEVFGEEAERKMEGMVAEMEREHIKAVGDGLIDPKTGELA